MPSDHALPTVDTLTLEPRATQARVQAGWDVGLVGHPLLGLMLAVACAAAIPVLGTALAALLHLNAG